MQFFFISPKKADSESFPKTPVSPHLDVALLGLKRVQPHFLCFSLKSVSTENGINCEDVFLFFFKKKRTVDFMP